MKSFRINRAKWLSGNFEKKFGTKAPENSMLRDHNGNMCCLGFLGEACGISKRRMLEVGTPADLIGWSSGELPRPMQFLVDSSRNDSQEGLRLMALNDNENVTFKAREQRLINAFKKQGIKLTFYGKYPVAK